VDEIDGPKIIEFGVRLGKDSVSALLDVLRRGDWRELLAYIDEDEAWRTTFAFIDLDITETIKFIESDEKDHLTLLRTFTRL